MSIGGLVKTKTRLSTQPIAKQRKSPRIKSALRDASMAGTITATTIITCCANLMKESSGLKAHDTLKPAKAR